MTPHTPTRIGITGGIGSGKSFVCQILMQDFDIPVYDCDREAKRLVSQSADIRQQLQTLVGATDKATLTAYVFASDDNATRVNAIVHPAVKADFRQWCAQQSAPIVAIESAILQQAGFESEVDILVAVTASRQTRMDRATARDNATPQQVCARMQRQQEATAQYYISNENGTDRQHITEQITNILLQCSKQS